MRRFKITIAIIALLMFMASPALGILPPGYLPPDSLPDKTSIIEDANIFIRAQYGLEEDYFEDPRDIPQPNKTFKSVPLLVEQDYNVSDDPKAQFTGIMPYYYKQGGGPGRTQQFLGQTRDGYTITNVRFPMVANWRFIEELDWAEIEDNQAIKWWESRGHDLPENNQFNAMAESDSRLLDFCIGICLWNQVREWDGKQYYQSKAYTDLQGNPVLVNSPRDQIHENLLIPIGFPWHKYVHVLQPPTYNTWGYGIGFCKKGNSYSYKSFPIAPLQAALSPDFYPTAPQTEYVGKPGETVTIPVTLHNSGEVGTTDIGAAWYGSGWVNPLMMHDEVILGKDESQDFEFEAVVPNPGQETRIVVAANIDGKTPANEINQRNNQLIITVKPLNQVDIAVKVWPIQKSYTMGWNSNFLTPGANVKVTRKDTGDPVNVRLTMNAQPGGTAVEEFVLKAGEEYFSPHHGKVTGPGKCVISAEAWPIGVEDVYPADNKDSCTITINQKKLSPKKNYREPGIHVELGDM